MSKFACPKCGATPERHGKGECLSRNTKTCVGFICECSDDGTVDHGETLANPCREANCYHCEWGGTVPAMPAKWPAWAKKAAEEGWTAPDGWMP